jgi:hypothetical protein
MLINEQLALMNSEDLCQRYNNSFILYGGEPILVNSIQEGWIYFQDSDAIAHSSVFNHTLLDTARPRSRWFSNEKYKFFISYPPKKQYLRGVGPSNTEICWLKGPPKTSDYFFDLLQEQYNPPRVNPLSVGEVGVFKDNLLVYLNEYSKNIEFWFRTHKIGMYSQKEVFTLYEKKYAQEIYEACQETKRMVHKAEEEEYDFNFRPALEKIAPKNPLLKLWNPPHIRDILRDLGIEAPHPQELQDDLMPPEREPMEDEHEDREF